MLVLILLKNCPFYAAKLSHCTAFITNDRQLPNIPKLKIIQLSDYVLA